MMMMMNWMLMIDDDGCYVEGRILVDDLGMKKIGALLLMFSMLWNPSFINFNRSSPDF